MWYRVRVTAVEILRSAWPSPSPLTASKGRPEHQVGWHKTDTAAGKVVFRKDLTYTLLKSIKCFYIPDRPDSHG